MQGGRLQIQGVAGACDNVAVQTVRAFELNDILQHFGSQPKNRRLTGSKPSAMPQMSKFLLASAAVSGTWAFLAPSAPRTTTSAQLRGAAGASGSAPGGLGSGAVVALGAAAVASTRRAGKAQRRAEDDAYGASHTSFYTDAVAKDKYDTLEEAGRNREKTGLQICCRVEIGGGDANYDNYGVYLMVSAGVMGAYFFSTS
jgi:hypothetical protein